MSGGTSSRARASASKRPRPIGGKADFPPSPATPSSSRCRARKLGRFDLERLAELDRIGHRRIEPVAVELALPAADHDGGDAVADEIGEGAALAHELVDADEEGERLD